MTRIVLAGASGFIGEFLARAYRARGADVSLIGRSGPDAAWGDTAAIAHVLDDADLLVNLAGKSVNCRYSAANRAEILRSRVATTRELSDAIEACHAPPPLWVNASTATIYRHAMDHPMTESTGEIGTGFSVGVASEWEHELSRAELPETRRVALRMAIVLGDGSALVPLLNLARTGFGGPQLDGPWPATAARTAAGTFHAHAPTRGHQRFSWVHIDDVFGIIEHLRAHPELDGPINAASPDPSDATRVMAIVRRAVRMPIGLPLPRPLLELGSMVIRTETELVLKSRWVVPERLLDSGYVFRHPELEPAVRSIVAARRSGPGVGGLF